MIISFEDILQEVYDEFPDITERSVERICRDGMLKSVKLLKTGRELIVKCPNLVEVKFFIPGSQEDQFARTKINEYKDKLKANGSKPNKD